MAKNSSSDRSYPLFKRNLKLEELYQKYEKKYSKMFTKKKFSGKDIVWMIVALAILLTIPIAISQVQKRHLLYTEAENIPETIIFEAENAILSNNASINSDISASNGKYVLLGPSDTKIDMNTCPELPITLISAVLETNIKKSEKYYFWVRMMATEVIKDSFFIQIDENCPILVGNGNFTQNMWKWINFQDGDVNKIISFNLSTGKHKISIYSREKSVKVDKLITTTDKNCRPSLKGDNCK